MLVNKSTMHFKSSSLSEHEAGKIVRYEDRSIRKELCSWSKSLTNFSFCKFKKKINLFYPQNYHCQKLTPKLLAANRSLAETALEAVVCA
jgi:hypothetical protein